MTKKKIAVPNYINGRFIYQDDYRIIEDVEGDARLKIHLTDKWDIEAAIETASRTQPKLSQISSEEVAEVLRRTSLYFLNDDYSSELISMVTGSPIKFINQSIQEGKEFCSAGLEFLSNTFGSENYNLTTSPTVCVLPSNSEVEVPWVLAQVLLSRNSSVVRPSSKGACSYTSFKFVKALNLALNDLDKEFSSLEGITEESINEFRDEFINPLKSSISVINTSSRDYLKQLSIDGFNYVVFGDENTVHLLKNQITESLEGKKPRKVIGYGTGLSKSIVNHYSNLEQAAKEIAESITINTGNECVGTDILYIHKTIADEFLTFLKTELTKYKPGKPSDYKKDGFIGPERSSYIIDELTIAGKEDYISRTICGNSIQLLPCIIPVHPYEICKEYPGPIVSVRVYESEKELIELVKRDNQTNNLSKNLVTSIYADDEEFCRGIIPLLDTHKVYIGRPTHSINLLKEVHQGRNLTKELTDSIPIYR